MNDLLTQAVSVKELTTIVGGQFPLAFLLVKVMDWLKRATWFKVMSNDTEKINRIVSMAVAFASASGLMVVTGDATHGWQISIAALPVLLDAGKHILIQWAFQDLSHKQYGSHQAAKEQLAQTQAIRDELQQLKTALANPQAGH